VAVHEQPKSGNFGHGLEGLEPSFVTLLRCGFETVDFYVVCMLP